VLVLAGILILLLPRKYVIFPVLVTAFLVPMDQILVVGPFHFFLLRVLLFFGLARMLGARLISRCTILSGGMNSMDKAVLLLGVFGAVTYVLLRTDWNAVVNQLGVLYTLLGGYFLVRFLIRDQADVIHTLRVLVYVQLVMAGIMLVEEVTGRSPYVVFGGAREFTRESLIERNNRFRAMAAFGHPINAGTFGATSLPLFVGLWWTARANRRIALAGVVAATVITITSGSSTPFSAYLAGVGALCLWPLRKQMRLIRWGIVGGLTSLHLVMKAPVWALIWRLDFVGGSGAHRYDLVNQFIRHFGDWWLLGTQNNAQWGPETWDMANQYVYIGETYGFLPFICFLSTIVFGFKYLGAARKASENRTQQVFFWSLGAALFSHVIVFLGIAYLDQVVLLWYVLLAIISAATAPCLAKDAAPGEPAVAELPDSAWISPTPTCAA
jgi:hypothetical protein